MEAHHFQLQSKEEVGKATLASNNLSIPAQVAMDFDIAFHDRPGFSD
jgi:hypothetical protein